MKQIFHLEILILEELTSLSSRPCLTAAMWSRGSCRRGAEGQAVASSLQATSASVPCSLWLAGTSFSVVPTSICSTFRETAVLW